MEKLTKKEMKQIMGGEMSFWGYNCYTSGSIPLGCYAVRPDFPCIYCVLSEQPCEGPALTPLTYAYDPCG